MRITVYLIFIALAVSCAGKKENTPSETNDAPDMHQANIALDYWGEYSGTLPCADCEGIETLLVLTKENKYILTRTYLGKSAETFESEGQFEWNEAGNTISLIGEEGSNQYFVGENVLFHLDQDGKRISGDLAEKYILFKN